MLCLSDETKFEEMRQLREHEGKNDIISIFVCLTAFFLKAFERNKKKKYCCCYVDIETRHIDYCY